MFGQARHTSRDGQGTQEEDGHEGLDEFAETASGLLYPASVVERHLLGVKVAPAFGKPTRSRSSQQEGEGEGKDAEADDEANDNENDDDFLSIPGDAPSDR